MGATTSIGHMVAVPVAVDTYTSRLETNLRLLSQRLAWLDGQARELSAENDALRRELDRAGRGREAALPTRADETSAAERVAAAADAERLREFEERRSALATRLSELEERARTRIGEIRASSERLEDATKVAAEPEIAEELEELEVIGPDSAGAADPAAELEALAARRDEAAALDVEIAALLRLRGTIVASVREMLIGLAEELAHAEREHLATLPPPEGEPLEPEGS